MNQQEYFLFQKLLFLMFLVVMTLLLFIYRLYHPPAYLESQLSSPYQVQIVYFANLFVNPSHGPQLVQEQMKDLVSTGLLRVATLHIVLSVPDGYDPTIQEKVSQSFHPSHKVVFHIHHENCHEYPGIQLAHDLAYANGSPHHYILYFHSKGITRFYGERDIFEVALHKTVIAPWDRVLNIFQDHPHIDKVGSTSSKTGWIWWNYWWARASYLVHVETPIKTRRRHYYEDWLSRVLADPQKNTYLFTNKNCWSLSAPDQPIGKGYGVKEATYLVLTPSSQKIF